jgi:hypothetical protein
VEQMDQHRYRGGGQAGEEQRRQNDSPSISVPFRAWTGTP